MTLRSCLKPTTSSSPGSSKKKKKKQPTPTTKCVSFRPGRPTSSSSLRSQRRISLTTYNAKKDTNKVHPNNAKNKAMGQTAQARS